ncbi:hypothetical protein J4405_01575 [Candidatus Woesearchaeota archaeon]|nr:hypothetical protein [Candidatus Woesearchaeota archaeon]
MKKTILFLSLIVLLFLSGCVKDNEKSLDEFSSQSEKEKQGYCINLCGGLYTHDPCANECMMGKEVEKRDFSAMTKEEINQTCEYMCGSDPYRTGTTCVDGCIARNS